ncbi:MAG: NAD-dependent epimerase/dehydratase family protein [Streptosporangiaceae bacterium]
MRILIAGGTRFVGRHITQAALDAGHEVTLFHRGRSGAQLFPQATHLTGDRDGDVSAAAGLGALAGSSWDATIDVCAYFPRQVRTLAQALGGRGGRYVYISSTSAYSTPAASQSFSENASLAELADPLTEEITEETYGGLKVACERLAAELHGPDRVTIVRPTYVVGPYDRSYRFTWWIERIARGGEVLAPGAPDGPIQVIDARDMGRWIVALAGRPAQSRGPDGRGPDGREQQDGREQDGRAGPEVYHAVSPAPPYGFGDLLEAIAAEVAPPGTTLTWVSPEFLLERGEDAESLPLWPGGDPESDINTADPSAAYAAGLAPRPIRQTVAEIHAAEQAAPTPVPAGTGIGADREAELLAAWSARPV